MTKKEMIIATYNNIDDIVKLRVETQIEDWNNTLGILIEENVLLQ